MYTLAYPLIASQTRMLALIGILNAQKALIDGISLLCRFF